MHARHRAGDPDDLETLFGQWHVGRSFMGMFPTHEASCPCPKARCGLAAPVFNIECPEHFTQTIRQGHPAEDCARYMRALRRRRRR